jgi:hypothetical protein
MVFTISLVTPVTAQAADACPGSTADSPDFATPNNFPSEYVSGEAPTAFLRATGLDPNETWGIRTVHDVPPSASNPTGNDQNHRHIVLDVDASGNVNIPDIAAQHSGFFDNPDSNSSDMKLELYRGSNWESPDSVCEIKTFRITAGEDAFSCNIEVFGQDSQGTFGQGCIQAGRPIRFDITQSQGTNQPTNETMSFAYGGSSCVITGWTNGRTSLNINEGGRICSSIGYTQFQTAGRDYTVSMTRDGEEICDKTFHVYTTCDDEDVADDENDATTVDYDFCAQLDPNSGPYGECTSCRDRSGYYTALGCIQRQDGGVGIIQALVTIGLNLAGGVALLMILAAGFKFSISQGDPKRTAEAKEMLTSAIVGLLFVIFSVTILRFIGVDILRIPGFGE